MSYLPNSGNTGSIDISSQLTPSATYSSTNATNNATAINNAIIAAQTSNANTVAINTPGTYFSNQIVMYSNTNLELGAGVILKKPPSTVASMIISEGALQASPMTDTNIGILGQGIMDGNVANQSSLTRAINGAIAVNSFLYGVQGEVAMIGVNNFTFSLYKIQNCNGFCIQLIGNNGLINNVTVDTTRDFIHINGPSSHIVINNASGFSADAFIALNAWDWHVSGPTVGNINDVRINNVAYYGSNQGARTGALIAYLPGTRTTGYGTGTGNVTNVSVDGFVLDMTQGSVTPASPGIQPSMAKDTVNGSEYSGTGAIQNITMTNGYATIPNTNTPAFVLDAQNITANGQAQVTMENFVIKNTKFDASTAGTGVSPIQGIAPYAGWLIDNLKFEDCEWQPANSGVSNQYFINWASQSTVDSLVVDGLLIDSNTSTDHISALIIGQYSAGNASIINDLTLDRIRTAPGYALTGAWLYMNGGVINNFRSRGNYLYGTPSGQDGQGIFFANATSQIVRGIISDGYFNGVKEGIEVNNAVSSGNAATLVFENCQVINQTHPVFVNGAFNVDVTYIGGSINTAANLARVATGFAVLSYSDTVATGAGDATVTLVTSGTVQIRKSDRIAIGTTIVLTPQNNDLVNFSGTPAYSGIGTVVGTGAGLYVKSTGLSEWLKLN